MLISSLNLNKDLKNNILHFKNRGIDPDAVKLYTVDEPIPFHDIDFITKEGKKKDKRRCLKEPLCLDTETSHDSLERGWIYQFCLKIGDIYIIGRKPSELVKAFMLIKEYYKLDENNIAVCYIHNASYDLQYLKMIFRDSFGESDILATAPRRIITLNYSFIDFRDSYILSQKSLKKWGLDLNCRVLKADGDDVIDYSEVRYQDSILTEKDWYYQVNDVEALYQCIKEEMKLYGNTLWNIPLTMTGYTRRDCRREYQKDIKNLFAFKNRRLSADLNNILLNAYMGAYTHGNRNYKGRRVRGPLGVGHRDYRSFYPSTCICDGYPITKFQRNIFADKEFILSNIDKYCFAMVIEISNIIIKPGITAPILSKDRYEKGLYNKLDRKNIIADNGRILKADGCSIMALTELDYKWILKQYDADIKIIDVYQSRKGKLPKYLRDVINYYFKKKTIIKQKLKNPNLTKAQRYNLKIEEMIAKARLNSIYGMLSTKIIRTKHIFDYNTLEWTEEKQEAQELLDKFYGSWNNFSEFQMGCWVTSSCRNRLLTLIEGLGYDKFIYADTDSIFYLKDEETEKYFQKINEDNYNERVKKEEYILDLNDEIVEYMAFEDEQDNIDEFKFLHSKCYGFYDKSGKMHITIAGVTQFWRSDKTKPIDDRRTREDELIDLDNLETGFTFNECGGTRSVYNEAESHIEWINGHETELEGSCIIDAVTKKLSESEYAFYDFAYGGKADDN